MKLAWDTLPTVPLRPAGGTHVRSSGPTCPHGKSNDPGCPGPDSSASSPSPHPLSCPQPHSVFTVLFSVHSGCPGSSSPVSVIASRPHRPTSRLHHSKFLVASPI